ncbi:transcriptional regulator [Haladaptatus sp. AB618]|uniref:transcriptional regulator n=1 Tax=Haladaptatus sp. AB618 TaxID=2934173 RepID=UPI00209C2F33|nr:transcriptional regulator [Haladaptatus sp. AB618]MCO8256783.1 transcriptional regulator [Haladaptatus sp. AB618]
MSEQSSPADLEDRPSFETIQQSLGEPRRDLLTAFLEADKSTLNTAQLREHSAVPRGSAIHHLERLTEWGLVMEKEQREYHGRGGSHARSWALTERGSQFCDDYLDTPVSAFVSPEDVAALDERLSTLENDVEQMKAVIVKIAVHTGTLTEDQAEELLEE